MKEVLELVEFILKVNGICDILVEENKLAHYQHPYVTIMREGDYSFTELIHSIPGSEFELVLLNGDNTLNKQGIIYDDVAKFTHFYIAPPSFFWDKGNSAVRYSKLVFLSHILELIYNQKSSYIRGKLTKTPIMWLSYLFGDYGLPIQPAKIIEDYVDYLNDLCLKD